MLRLDRKMFSPCFLIEYAFNFAYNPIIEDDVRAVTAIEDVINVEGFIGEFNFIVIKVLGNSCLEFTSVSRTRLSRSPLRVV